MKGMIGVALASLLTGAIFLAGCERSGNPMSSSSGMQGVNLTAAFTKSSVSSLSKTDGTMATDSLEIDSAIVVFQRIKFESHVDSVMIDSTSGHDSDDNGIDDNVTFKGPFVVHIRDTSVIDFANQTLPAGTYDGIKFKIHALRWAERFEDSDDFNHHPRMASDTSFMGASIVVWGRVMKNGAWVPFEYKYWGEAEYKLKGNFVVPATTSSIDIVLRFDMGSWFKDPRNGALLDPTDTSFFNRAMINLAIRRSFESGHGGHDRDHDGHPDND